ncbi:MULTISPECIES: hypothetical protein [Shewanella]|uniref:hypothetical protein n=1 Tax=Shewanella TaxID=22 RepID=UPI001BC0630C|nr:MULTISPECIES: hypothetical protein [Shewanella]GIU50881.1 hypothetical protein TUM4249_13320 [Shewanella sp. KT0246]
MKRSTLATLLLSSLIFTGTYSSAIVAEEKPEHDPSDLTKATTSGYAAMSNKGDLKVSISGSFSVSPTQEGMLTLEGTMNNEGEYSDSRLQYFHVFDLESTAVPKVAMSLDMINNDAFTTAAIGGIASITLPSDKVNLFVRAGVLGGEYSDDFVEMMGESDTATYGATGDIFLILKTGNDGTYFMINPEYTYMTGSIETSVLKTTLEVATPLSQDKTRWGQIKIENTLASTSSTHFDYSADETVVWALYKAYF